MLLLPVFPAEITSQNFTNIVRYSTSKLNNGELLDD